MDATIGVLLDLLCPSGEITESQLADDLAGLLECPELVRRLAETLVVLQRRESFRRCDLCGNPLHACERGTHDACERDERLRSEIPF